MGIYGFYLMQPSIPIILAHFEDGTLKKQNFKDLLDKL